MWQAFISAAVILTAVGPATFSEHEKGIQQGSGELRDVRRHGATRPDSASGVTRDKRGDLLIKRD